MVVSKNKNDEKINGDSESPANEATPCNVYMTDTNEPQVEDESFSSELSGATRVDVVLNFSQSDDEEIYYDCVDVVLDLRCV